MGNAEANVIGSLARQEPYEDSLKQEVSMLEQQASFAAVTTDAEYARAGDFVRKVKARKKLVTEFWEPMREKTEEAYKEVLSKKKSMLEPLDKAEAILKGKMSSYIAEKERKRREQEEAMRRLAQQEVERKLQEAANADSSGDSEAAEAAFAEAEIMDSVAVSGVVSGDEPKVSGVSVSKDWVIVSISSTDVPISMGGVELRPVDEKAVLRLIKASKGTAQIPGVRYEEVKRISVRS